MTKAKKHKFFIFFSLATAFGLGVFFGYRLNSGDIIMTAGDSDIQEYYEVRAGSYRLINPLLECEISGDRENLPLQPLKLKISDFIEKQREQAGAKSVSVYFRDLNNGPWFGINEKEQFAPASLLKAPMMVALYKLAEDNPELLDAELDYQGQYEDLVNLDETSQTLEPGQSYSISELIRKMVVYSDNKSMKLLQNYLINRADEDMLMRTAAEIGLIAPVDPEAEDAVMVKQYAGIFRILYNASYLSKTMSEKALGLLAESDYNVGLAAGIPDEIIIANKFGYFFDNKNGERQLHDCGIIYYPDRPYLACVMTRGGNNKDNLEYNIRSISRFIYEYVDASANKQ